MVGLPTRDAIADLLARHADLEATSADALAGDFLSGWQCENPWQDALSRQVLAERTSINDGRYLYLEDDELSRESLAAFHEVADGLRPTALFCGAGSSSILFAFCAYLRDSGVEEVFYLPPLYYTMHAALRLLGIRARPISGRQAYEDGFRPNWPEHRCVFLLCDPIWYCGLGLHPHLISRLAEWQARTGSTVFVDGSFQYMRWDGVLREETTRLEPERTIRLICPTKALGLHGFRFAHAIMPRALRDPFASIYAGIYGSTSADSLAFARVAARVLLAREIVPALMQEAGAVHRRLREAQAISSPWSPDRGYFVFERINVDTGQDHLLMDGSFFEQRRLPAYRRINLLSPKIGVLGQ